MADEDAAALLQLRQVAGKKLKTYLKTIPDMFFYCSRLIDRFESIRNQKRLGMAMFRRTTAGTIRRNVREPHMKMWGFETKGPESSPELCRGHRHGILLPYFLRPRK